MWITALWRPLFFPWINIFRDNHSQNTPVWWKTIKVTVATAILWIFSPNARYFSVDAVHLKIVNVPLPVGTRLCGRQQKHCFRWWNSLVKTNFQFEVYFFLQSHWRQHKLAAMITCHACQANPPRIRSHAIENCYCQVDVCGKFNNTCMGFLSRFS